jgi:hypothetical protein
LQARLAVGHQPLGGLGLLALRLLAHLREDLLQVLNLLLSIVNVRLDHALKLPVGDLPEHLLLGLEELVLGVVGEA